MCYNCGCHIPQDDMGHADNITTLTFHELSHKWGIDESDVKKAFLNQLQGTQDPKFGAEIDEVLEKASKAWGQSLDEARKNTLGMLLKEVKD